MKVYAQWKKPTPPTPKPDPKPDPKPTTPILRIIKIDGDGNRIPLPVTFKITDKMFPGINRVVTTDTSGEAKVAYLTTGDYSLEEIKTPEGYVPLDKPLSFSIKDGLIRYENDIVRTIYIKNDKKMEEPDVIKPIDDPTRQDIAATISKTYFGDAKKVILVQNMAYADSMSAMNVSQGNIPILYTQKDALVAGPVAQKLNAPVLLTRQSHLPMPIDAYLNTHTNLKQILLIGGPASIGESVRNTLKAIFTVK